MISKYPLRKHTNIKYELRISELCKWFTKHRDYINIPYITHRAMDQYNMKESTAEKYAREVVARLNGVKSTEQAIREKLDNQ